MRKDYLHITGILSFQPKKVILQTDDGSEYFVRFRNTRTPYFHGDHVSARCTKKASAGKMAEVRIQKLLTRTKSTLIARVMGKYVQVLPLFWNQTPLPIITSEGSYTNGDFVEIILYPQGAKVLKLYKPEWGRDPEVASILMATQIPTTEHAKTLPKYILKKHHAPCIPVDTPPSIRGIFHTLKDAHTSTYRDPDIPLASTLSDGNTLRIDLSNWYTLTIDGHDARDLDDAISLASTEPGDILLGVHIADVAHFVEDGSPIDQEARKRGCSVYLPGEVIPMLPEYLANDLCSLHPWQPKRTITCLMRIDSRTGRVKHTDVFCSRIESQKRGIYDDIWNSYTRREYHTPGNPETHTLRLAFMLHDTLEKRRKKEGKILFETEEIQWNPEDKEHTFSPSLRTRNTAHTLIEECMILANEEIAKWCTKRNIPFLSRIHDAPSPEDSAHIQSIIQHPHPHIHPKDIRDYLDQIQDPGALYRATRLLLPKMTKATYSEKRCPHFWLALEYYSHFTSPIRRYPDLVTHRMIRAYLSRSQTAWYASKKLHRIALESSDRERRAEGIESIIDQMYASRYMASRCGEIHTGTISSLTEWGIFALLSCGIEVAVSLPHKKYHLDPLQGTLSFGQKVLYTIGDTLSLEIDHIDAREYRIWATIPSIKRTSQKRNTRSKIHR